MVKTLERALAEVAALPESAQEQLGRDLLAYVAKLRNLRQTVNDSIERGGSNSDEDVASSVAARLDAWERKRN